MYDLIFKNGNVFTNENKIQKIDLGIKSGVISTIGNLNNSKAKNIIDLKNLLVLPGCIDSQVHFREPGLIYKEDIESGTRGAILGGITSIFEMPNTKPNTTSIKAFNQKMEIAKKKAFCNYAFFIGASKNNYYDLEELEKLSGCSGVKIFMGSSTGNLLVEDDENLRKVLSNGKRRVSVHSEDEFRLRERKYIIEGGNTTVADHPLWRDVETAVTSTKRLIKIATECSRNIHILHISTKDEIEIIGKNKKYVSSEVTPQHLYFHSPECYTELGSLCQMNPPIRTKDHKEGLWDGIRKKIIDVIGSDHAPHTIDEKKKKYPDCPSGMTGVQTLVPVMLNFVNEKKLSISDFVRLTSTNPAKLFGVKNKGFIKIGFDADLTIVDLKKKHMVENKDIVSKSSWSPYDGKIFQGWPVMTVIHGNIVMRENEIIGKRSGHRVLFS